MTGYNAFIPKFDISKFMTSYIGIAIYVVNILVWKIWHRTSRVKASSMDLYTDRKRFEDEAEEARLASDKVKNVFSNKLSVLRAKFSKTAM